MLPSLCNCGSGNGDDNINFFLAVVPLKKKKPGKNPDVDTSFLPDREREVMMTSESGKYFKRLCFLLSSEKHTHKKNSLQVKHGKHKHPDDISTFEIVNLYKRCVPL